jgi:taurine dioxygenase
MADGAFQLRPLAVGAEVTGIAPGAKRDPETAAALHAAWLEHGLLLFRDVDTIDRHLSLSRAFGELEMHPYPELRSGLNELLIEIGGSKRPPAYVFDDVDVRVNRIPWHRDTLYTPDTCKGAMLRMVVSAAEEGETLFADTARAYDDLPDAMKQRLAGLEYKASLRIDPGTQCGPGAIWQTARRATPEEDPEKRPAAVARPGDGEALSLGRPSGGAGASGFGPAMHLPQSDLFRPFHRHGSGGKRRRAPRADRSHAAAALCLQAPLGDQ